MPEGDVTPPLLSRADAQRVLKRNLTNLVGKVQAGRLLTNSELAIIQGLSEGQPVESGATFAANQVDLAKVLGVTRKSVERWRKEGAPTAAADGRWDVVAWRAWMKTNSKKGGDAESDASAGPTKTQLEAKRLLLMNEKLEHEIAVMRGAYTLNTEIERQFTDLCTEVKKVLNAMPAALAPQVVGVSVPEAAKRIQDAVDDALMRLHTGTHPKGTESEAA